MTSNQESVPRLMLHIQCELCQRGLQREYRKPGTDKEITDFMVAHNLEYAIFSKHVSLAGEAHKPRYQMTITQI